MGEWVLGQMSGTSLDGVDVALLRTDGGECVAPGPGRVFPYRDVERDAIRAGTRAALGSETQALRDPERWPEAVRRADAAATEAHLRAVREFLRAAGPKPSLVGYHGQTLLHRPEEGFTLQVGNPLRLARESGLPVAYGMRHADLEAGGQGAPLAPFFHHALARSAGLVAPVAFLNLGGVANVTFVDPAVREPDAPGALAAFDTGPGCALLDEWAESHGSGAFDRDGALARRGTANVDALATFLDEPFFRLPPPKSLDRSAFSLDGVRGLSAADGAATLVAFTVASAVLALQWLDTEPKLWLVTGGGRLNPAIVEGLRRALALPVRPVESVGWDGDLLEAWAFAYLGMRARTGLAISAPATTGCSAPAVAGRIARPA